MLVLLSLVVDIDCDVMRLLYSLPFSDAINWCCYVVVMGGSPVVVEMR